MNTGIKNKTFTYILKWWGGPKTYKVTFKQSFPLTFNCHGKTWAKNTECIIDINGKIIATNKVIKHDIDKDSTLYAYMNAFRPISKYIYREARINLTNQILEYAKVN